MKGFLRYKAVEEDDPWGSGANPAEDPTRAAKTAAEIFISTISKVIIQSLRGNLTEGSSNKRCGSCGSKANTRSKSSSCLFGRWIITMLAMGEDQRIR
jgi:hypothetical protein